MTIPSRPRAVVTGAGSGLGRELCLALARKHAHVIVADINTQGAEETAHLVTQLGGTARMQTCDVAKPEQLEQLARFADAETGGTDLLINNAGVAVGGKAEEVPLRDWEWILSINLWGVIHGCREFIPRLKQQRSGHILNVASAAGLTSAPEMAPYNVSKAGVVSLSETLYSELRPFGVGVTVLCPSFFKTGLLAHARTQQPELVSTADTLMRKSKVQAPEVATRALEACERDKLYCVPMVDAQIGWRMRGLAPETFYSRVLTRMLASMGKRP